ncbi:MAG: efflux RND transporter periplasmic adaptor subunit [Planctomycetota bacterium]
MTQSNSRYLPLLTLILVSGILLAYALWPAAIIVDLAPVTRGSLQVTVAEDGKTRVKERYIISAPLAGQMSRIDFHAGDDVEAEKTVLTTISPIDPLLLDARALAEAEARVSAAEAALEQSLARLDAARESQRLAEDQFLRAKRLITTRSIPPAEYDQAEHEERIAAGALRAAEFGNHVAQFELTVAQAAFIRTRPKSDPAAQNQRLEVRSPVAGQVLRVIHESAGVVTAGQQLIEIGNPRELELEIDLLSADAARTKPGAKVLLEQWGGTAPLRGRVRLIEPSGFMKVSALGVEEQRVNVIADFEETPETLLPLGDAFRVEARIVIWESPEVTKVPAGALFRQGDSWAVFLAQQGRVERRLVTIGQNNGQEAEVLEGLVAGDMVVVYPSDQVRAGRRVRSRG